MNNIIFIKLLSNKYTCFLQKNIIIEINCYGNLAANITHCGVVTGGFKNVSCPFFTKTRIISIATSAFVGRHCILYNYLRLIIIIFLITYTFRQIRVRNKIEKNY